MSEPRSVTVLGAGVVGLTAARALQDAGFDVRVVAEASGLEESSGAAGAVWFVYGPGLDSERVQRFARETHARLCALARTLGAAGVRVVPAYVAVDETARPDWAGSMPAEAELAFVECADLPLELQREVRGRGPACGWRFRAPVVDPALHLAWLEAGLARPIERRRVADLRELPGLVVNCTGRLAERLVDDPSLEPRRGRTALVTRGRLPRDHASIDDRDETALFYSIPRGPAGSEVVLGGIDVARTRPDEELASSPAELAAILARARSGGIDPEGPVVEKFGWRPSRRGGPRVEREGRIVHDYGHGGAGYTLAYGSARAVVELVREAEYGASPVLHPSAQGGYGTQSSSAEG